MRKQIEFLNEKNKELLEEKQMSEVLNQEKDSNLNSTVPDKFMKKIKVTSKLSNLLCYLLYLLRLI